MGQLNNVPGGDYAREFDPAVAGQLFDTALNKRIESKSSSDTGNIGFGYGITHALEAALFGTVRLPRLNSQVLTGSADLGASNSTVLTINGVALAPVVYITSHDATMALLVAAAQAADGVLSASATGRALTIVMESADAVASAVTSGGSAVTWSAATATTTDTVAGIALYTPTTGTLPTPEQASEGVPYQPHDTVNVLESGIAVVQLASGVTVSTIAPAYIVTAAGANRGKFTTVSTANLRCGSFRPDLDPQGDRFGLSGGVCPVELVNPRVAA